MSMMIVATNKDIEPWIESFRVFNKNIDIQIYPHIKNKDDITFALVWSQNDINFQDYKNLKCISSMGAGVDHILSNKTISDDIFITKIVDYKLVDSMWEYLLSIVMNIVTNQYTYKKQQQQKVWKVLESKNINDTTIGILGLGQLGSNISQHFSNMNFKVKGFSHSKKDIKGVKSFTNLDMFLENVDILINLLPLTSDTKGILNYLLFKKLNKSAYLVNVGRGEHLVEDDLIKALDDNILAGATLDVFQVEPLEKNHPFWNNDKINITPHSASITNPLSVTQQIMENYQRVQEGKKVLHTIDIKVGY